MTNVTGPTGGQYIPPEDMVGYDHKAEKGAASYINVREDGSLDTNFSWRISQKYIDKCIPVLTECVEFRESLESQLQEAKAAGKTDLANTIQGQINTLDSAVQTLKNAVEVRSPKENTTAMAMGALNSLTNTLALLKGADQSALLSTPVESGAVTKPLDVATGTTPSGAEKVDMSEGEVKDFGDHVMTAPASDLAKEFAANPQGTWDKISQLPDDQKKFALQQLQAGMQENNQMFTMFTNFLKAMHDTDKAIIANLRV